MMKHILSISLCCIVTVLPLAAQSPIYLKNSAPIEARVQDALSRMTLEEKVNLCAAQSKFSSPGVERLGIPELWWSDGPHGVRAELVWDEWKYADWTSDYITAFPALTCLAATWNPKMAAIYGKAIGEEARYRKKDVLLGPGVNIYRTPLNGRNFEYMGEDPQLAAKLVVPYIQELQKNGVAASVKHYALNNQELHRWTTDVQVSDRALYEIYLPAFRAAIVEANSWTIMGAYNKYRGQYACHNHRLLQEILNGEWGYKGVVVSDWSGTHDTKEAALNGLDVEMGSHTNGLTTGRRGAYSDYYLADAYLQGLEDGTYPLSTVEEKTTRILRLIFRTAMNVDRPWGNKNTIEHAQVARQVAQEGIVLLQNRAVSKKQGALLPLQVEEGTRILVVGENATRSHTLGGGSSELKAKYEISPLEALEARYGAVEYAMGYAGGPSSYGNVVPATLNSDSLRQDAVSKAAAADVVIYVGGLNKNHKQDCEDGDRDSLNLSFGQDRLIEELVAANKNVVVVLHSGNGVAMPWLSKVPAIVQSWYLGSESGNALVDVLSGDVNPSGKLPFTFYQKLEDCGAHAFDAHSYPGVDRVQGYKEDVFVGYRWVEHKKIRPLFAFGHGLSYTSYKYGALKVKGMTSAARPQLTPTGVLTLRMPLTNVGERAGQEIVQLYIGDQEASVVRPLKELKHFTKLALQPGETQEVEFTITPQDLAFFDETAHQWKAEKGLFTLYVGAASDDIRSKAIFELVEDYSKKP